MNRAYFPEYGMWLSVPANALRKDQTFAGCSETEADEIMESGNYSAYVSHGYSNGFTVYAYTYIGSLQGLDVAVANARRRAA